MPELSCDTPFIGRNETDDLSLYHNMYMYVRRFYKIPQSASYKARVLPHAAHYSLFYLTY
jgi:hypothetical protein